MDKLYNWLFWYNSYETQWFAFERDNYTKFFSGQTTEFKTAETFEELIELVLKYVETQQQ